MLIPCNVFFCFLERSSNNGNAFLLFACNVWNPYSDTSDQTLEWSWPLFVLFMIPWSILTQTNRKVTCEHHFRRKVWVRRHGAKKIGFNMKSRVEVSENLPIMRVVLIWIYTGVLNHKSQYIILKWCLLHVPWARLQDWARSLLRWMLWWCLRTLGAGRRRWPRQWKL
jgi:hypothetical protein